MKKTNELFVVSFFRYKFAVEVKMKHKFKYQEKIDELLSMGCQLPVLFEPNSMKACRFAFSAKGYVNHVPQYMSNPKRMLQDISKGKQSISLLALSCFTTPEKAGSFYANLCKAFKNISKSLGDSLAEGTLSNEDGLKTSTSENGHFDFYEYESCDLNETFQIIKKMQK